MKFGARVVGRVEVVLNERPGLAVWCLCLTIPNVEGLRGGLVSLVEGWRGMWDRARWSRRKAGGSLEAAAFRPIEGFVWQLEIKRGADGRWHPHIHIMALVDEGKIGGRWRTMPARWKAAVVREWGESVGVGVSSQGQYVRRMRVRGDRVSSLCGAVAETVKYPLKFAELGPVDIVDAYSASYGFRLTRTGGCLWGVKEPEQLADDDLYMGPYVDRLFRMLGGEYQLISEVEGGDREGFSGREG